MTPDEVRMLDNRYALLFIRGERPIMDEKYDILKHPNVGLSADGGAEAYLHGTITEAVGGIQLVDDSDGKKKKKKKKSRIQLISYCQRMI